jgi:diaphanous 1
MNGGKMMAVPRLSERLNCMVYRRKLEMDLEELRAELSILRAATDEMRQSERFKRVLEAVLAVGNALNASTYRGNARGFQLEALVKVRPNFWFPPLFLYSLDPTALKCGLNEIGN